MAIALPTESSKPVRRTSDFLDWWSICRTLSEHENLRKEERERTEAIRQERPLLAIRAPSMG